MPVASIGAHANRTETKRTRILIRAVRHSVSSSSRLHSECTWIGFLGVWDAVDISHIDTERVRPVEWPVIDGVLRLFGRSQVRTTQGLSKAFSHAPCTKWRGEEGSLLPELLHGYGQTLKPGCRADRTKDRSRQRCWRLAGGAWWMAGRRPRKCFCRRTGNI